MGIPAVAFSQVHKGWEHLDAAAVRARALVLELKESHILGSKPWLLNVNVPNKPLDQLGSSKICRLGRRHAAERVITQENPRGETMYWIGGAGAAKDDASDTDFYATKHGHVSITPLQIDLTEYAELESWSKVLNK